MTLQAHVDANVISRYLIGEPKDLASRATHLFQRAEAGEVTLVVESITIAEVAWTLESFYKRRPDEIAPVLREFLLLDGVEAPERATLLAALNHYEVERVDFGDALLAAKMEGAGSTQIFSFDRHLDRVPGISAWNLS